MSDIIHYAFAIFLIANPTGNCPAIVALIKDFDLETQNRIMRREWLLSLGFAFFFLLIGESFLSLLGIATYAVTIAGGVLLLFVALFMIFPREEETKDIALRKEPCLVPIATPLIAGPSLMAALMIYSKQSIPFSVITISLFIAWVIVGVVLLASPYMLRYLGKRGLMAFEQLMGMVVCMLAVQLMVKGSIDFIKMVKAG